MLWCKDLGTGLLQYGYVLVTKYTVLLCYLSYSLSFILMLGSIALMPYGCDYFSIYGINVAFGIISFLLVIGCVSWVWYTYLEIEPLLEHDFRGRGRGSCRSSNLFSLKTQNAREPTNTTPATSSKSVKVEAEADAKLKADEVVEEKVAQLHKQLNNVGAQAAIANSFV